VTLDLTEDARHGERSELDATRRLVPVDRIDQADCPDLDEVLQLLAAVRVSPRERFDEWQPLFDQSRSRFTVSQPRAVRANC
jgi:hypothetical protein